MASPLTPNVPTTVQQAQTTAQPSITTQPHTVQSPQATPSLWERVTTPIKNLLVPSFLQSPGPLRASTPVTPAAQPPPRLNISSPQMSTMQTSMQHQSNVVKIKKCFSGTESLSDFLLVFESAASANGWDQSTKATQLIVHLEGAALRIATSVDPSVRGNYDLLVHALKRHYLGPGHQAKSANELERRIRKPNETPTDFLLALQRLMREAKPDWNLADPTVDEILKDMFIRKLGNMDMSMYVKRQGPVTLQDAVLYASQYEEAYVYMNATHTGETTVNVIVPSSTPDATLSATPPLCSVHSGSLNSADQEVALTASNYKPSFSHASGSQSQGAARGGQGRGGNSGGGRGRGRGRGYTATGPGGLQPPAGYRKLLRVKRWNCGGTGHYQRSCSSPTIINEEN